MQVTYMAGDCLFREEIKQIFTIKINKEIEPGSGKYAIVPGVAFVNYGELVLMFSKEGYTVEHCNAKIRSFDIDGSADLTEWNLMNAISYKDFEQMRLDTAEAIDAAIAKANETKEDTVENEEEKADD